LRFPHRRFVIGKLTNQRQRLQRHNGPHRDADIQRSIGQLTETIRSAETLPTHHQPGLKPLATGDHRVEGTPLERVLGIEGAGSSAYFRCFGKLLSDPRQWPFPGRVKRPATDSIRRSTIPFLGTKPVIGVVSNCKLDCLAKR